MEWVKHFILGGSEITADGDWSHEIKRCLLLGRKAMTNLDSILKSRDITLPTKTCLAKVMVFPVAIYGCESWIIKKDEHQRIDAFELWCWRRLFESLLDCKEIKSVNTQGNQSWIFVGRTDTEAETSILWPPDEKNWLIGKDPDPGEDWRQEKKGKTKDDGWMDGWMDDDGWMPSLTQWTWVWISSRSWCWTGKPGVLQSMWLQRVGHNWAIELNWRETEVNI